MGQQVDYAAAKWIGCAPANYSVGRSVRGVLYKPSAIVIHVMGGSLYGTDAFFLNSRPNSPSSAHYGIGREWQHRNDSAGPVAVHQYVRESDTAYHAGIIANATWRGLRAGVNPNAYTVGIEHEGTASSDWSDALYAASAALVADICKRWAIPFDREHIIGHREIDAVRRAGCPGRCDIDRLIAEAWEASKR